MDSRRRLEAGMREGLGGRSQDSSALTLRLSSSSFVPVKSQLKRTMKSTKVDAQSSHAEAVRDREAIQRAAEKINESRSTARAFLQRVGIITPAGKLSKAYR